MNHFNGKIIIVCFAGREKYLEIQKEYIFKILDTYQNSEYHLWNFCRNAEDNEYVKRLAKQHSHIKVFNQYYEGDNANTVCKKSVGVLCNCQKCRVGKWTEPYKAYAQMEEYKDAFFVKLDDDVVFVDCERFGDFVHTASLNRGKVISAFVINNGLCACFQEEYKNVVMQNNLAVYGVGKKHGVLNSIVRKIGLILQLPATPEDWWYLCTSVDFFRLSHKLFLSDVDSITRHVWDGLIPLPSSRFSINTICFDWNTMRKIAASLGSHASMNDEAVISKEFTIYMDRNFTTSHFHFSDQRSRISDDEESDWLQKYARLAKEFVYYGA